MWISVIRVDADHVTVEGGVMNLAWSAMPLGMTGASVFLVSVRDDVGGIE